MVRALVAACVFAAAAASSALRGPSAEHLRCCPGIGSPNEAVVEAQAISGLSDRLQKLKLELKIWQGKRRQAEEFQEKQMKNIERQAEIGKKHNAGHAASVEEVGKTHKKMMEQHMCTLIFGAHLMFDSDAEKRLMELCLGRQSLAMAAVHSHAEAAAEQKGPLLKENKDPFAPTEALNGDIMDSENVLELKAQGRALRDEVKEVHDGYFADMQKFAKEREEASADVDDVDEDYVDRRTDIWDGKDKAWEAVKGDFCPSIHSSPDEAVETAVAKCKSE